MIAGQWFLVPLKSGEEALGVVARVGRGGVLLGYFFARDQAEPSLIRPESAVLVRRFGDPALTSGKWPRVEDPTGRTFMPSDWPLPKFGRVDEMRGLAWEVEYEDNDVSTVVAEAPCSLTAAAGLPRDGVAGYGALEILLGGLLPAMRGTGEKGAT